MPLDGLRAWIGEVERKLGKRTRVFLVLSLIAIGGAGAAVYLAIDAQDNSVSESDVQALQQELEARIGGGTGGGAELAQLEAEVSELKAEVEKLEGKGGGSAGGGESGGSGSGGSNGSGGASGGSGSGSPSEPGASGGESSNGTGGGGNTAAPKPSGGDEAKLGELLQHAKEANEQAEGK